MAGKRYRQWARLLPLLILGCAACQGLWQDKATQERTGETGPVAPPGPQVLWTPVQLSWSHDAQIFSKDRSVYGLRLSALSADNRNVRGIDLGLGITGANRTAGLAASLIMNSTGELYGLQIAGLVNYNEGGPKGSDAKDYPTIGAQISLVGNKARLVGGLQVAGINFCEVLYGLQFGLGSGSARFYGLQTSLLGNMSQTGTGIQLAAYNYVEDLDGVQIGLVNSARSGFQIGLLNFNEQGFLPVFPFINF